MQINGNYGGIYLCGKKNMRLGETDKLLRRRLKERKELKKYWKHQMAESAWKKPFITSGIS